MQSNPLEHALVQSDTRSPASCSAPRRGVCIVVDGLRKSYAGREVLQAIDLQMAAGEFVAVVGRSGCGKSTLLLLDEPLGALDALTRIEMQQLIESLWQARGFTALLVTHDVQEAIALADRVVLIEDGRVTLDQRIALPRPRARGNALFAQLEERILARVLQHPVSAPDTALGDVSLLKTVSQVAWAI